MRWLAIALLTTLHVSGTVPGVGGGTCSRPGTLPLPDSLTRRVVTLPLQPCHWKLTFSSRPCRKFQSFAFDAHFDTTCQVITIVTIDANVPHFVNLDGSEIAGPPRAMPPDSVKLVYVTTPGCQRSVIGWAR